MYLLENETLKKNSEHILKHLFFIIFFVDFRSCEISISFDHVKLFVE